MEYGVSIDSRLVTFSSGRSLCCTSEASHSCIYSVSMGCWYSVLYGCMCTELRLLLYVKECSMQ